MAQLTMFILNRSPFSKVGSLLISARYPRWALFVICAAVGLIGLKGDALRPVSGLLGLYSAAHFCLCILGAAVAAVSVTHRNVLDLLQVKE